MPGRIEDYAMVGDLQTAALVGSDGSVDWLCFPRFDSPACFAALLGEDTNGHWRMAPTSGGRCTRRRYRGHTLVLETEWETPTGAIRVVDCMPPRGVAPDLVRVVEGKVSLTSELRIRFDYGHVAPWVTIEGREVRAVAGPDALWLRASAPHEEVGGEILSRFTVSEGERIPLVLTWSPSYGERPVAIDGLQAVDDTERFWLEWAGGISYEGRFQDAVYRSLLTLKGLTYEPSGGIVAAATTSLPETLGGTRNWDYRYCWLRDSTFTLGALVGGGLLDEARAWQQWVLRAVAGDPADAQIMYGIDGARRLPEYELPWLPGYEGASPVRIGNDAAGQAQGDVPGEVLAAAHVGRTAGIVPMERGWELQRWLAGRLQEAWKRPDNGIWESRGERQHFVYSKVMCWVAFDSLVKGVERFGLDGPVERWRAVRDEIHSDVLEKGFDTGRGTFTQAYGSRALDACALLIPRVGFLPYDDERVVSTVETIRNELTEDGLVLRYRTDQSDDGLAGREGSFLICSFWMVYALWGIGRHRDAEELFGRLLALRNDVGLLSEEYDTRAQRLVGNFPQAFTHLALVNCALRLSDREVNSGARE
ncbi:MAG TPA: glycoside hydrolase family 15 protein [Rubrobacter sp.]|jgi:GH15 family glucan-1,4-alpha-glucosidase|nr:glycoside hydrolase family 15 protein [Rubrobacter sp.]